MCASTGCLAVRLAPEKLVKTMEMDLRVKMWEAGLADEPLSIAALGGHLAPGLAWVYSLLLGCCCIQLAPR